MKKIISILFILIAVLQSQAAQVVFSHTNSVGQPDTNAFLVVPIGQPTVATGGIKTRSYPFFLTPAADGRLTNYLGVGHYLITNDFMGNGYVIRAPDDAGNTLYYAWNQAPSVLVTGAGIFVTITNGTASSISYNGITNSLGFVPATSNNLVAQIALESADFIVLSNYTKSSSNSLVTQTASSVATVGLNGTNYTKAAGQLLTNLTLLVGLNGTNYANSVGLAATNFATAIGLTGTNYTKAVGLLLTNLVGLCATNSTNFTLLVGLSATNYASNNFNFSTNYAKTNTAALVAAVTTQTNGLPSVLSTNLLGYVSAGTSQANGTYIWSGSAYTNAAQSALYVTNVGGTWFVNSNSVALYSGTSPTNASTVSFGTSPAPSAQWGRFITNSGNYYVGAPVNTNSVAVIASMILAQATTQTNDTRSQGALTTNYVNAVGLLLTNLALAIGSNDTNYINAVGLLRHQLRKQCRFAADELRESNRS
jgi:hypothetical protein